MTGTAFLSSGYRRFAASACLLAAALLSGAPPPCAAAPFGALTNDELAEATWEVVNAPADAVTKWGPINDWQTGVVTKMDQVRCAVKTNVCTKGEKREVERLCSVI